MSPSSGSQIDKLISELRNASDRAAQLFQARSPADLLKSPGPARWSAAQCIVHLNLSNRAYLPKLSAVLQEIPAKKNLSPGRSFHLNWNARLLKYWLEPPSRLRLPTTAPFQPIDVQPEVVLTEFREINERLIHILDAARDLALDAVKITSPFAETMKYNAYSAFVVIAAHNRRHLWQAERALNG